MRVMRRNAPWVAALALILLAAACSSGDDGDALDLSDYPYPVQHLEEIDDRDHFPTGQTYDGYNSNPPTSGPHADTFAPTGVSDLAVAKEVAVHNMEHAGVVVWYNCHVEPALDTDACAALRSQLSQVVLQEVADGNEVLMTAYSLMDTRIALTAWGYLDAFEEFDEARVSAFINTFECNFDPEGFC
ncbi:MAG: DUF3105 domain-containing protein [Chloroflexi bacterium]|nr:DUF3105 domain-containing protein [Chloroflexota bacterium]